ncbi:MAG: hypothetical protein A2V84_09735 [Chloroflexi bacterium RBG_16_70_13]|nr:MAG: hypothetical protein A2V84_09735 [Chloroflexi bacterium RBG_16_70_13]
MAEGLAQQHHVVPGRRLNPIREADMEPMPGGGRQAPRGGLPDEVMGEADRPADLDAETHGYELRGRMADAPDLPGEQLGDLVDQERARSDGQRGEQRARLVAQRPQALGDELRRLIVSAAPGQRLQPEWRASSTLPQSDASGLAQAAVDRARQHEAVIERQRPEIEEGLALGRQSALDGRPERRRRG